MSLITCNETTHFETKEYLEKKLEALKTGMGIPDEQENWKDNLRKVANGVPYMNYLLPCGKKIKKNNDMNLEVRCRICIIVCSH